MTLKELEFAHELDIAWIIALWLAIHGGDPGPEGVVGEIDETARALAATLVAHLSEVHGKSALSLEALKERAERLGVSVEQHRTHPTEQRRFYGCFKLGRYEWICFVPRPPPNPLPAA